MSLTHSIFNETARQQVARSEPVTETPLFSVLAAVVPSPPLQSTSSVLTVLPVHMPVVGSQQVATSAPDAAAPLFTVSVASPEQSTSSALSVLPVHMPVTVVGASQQETLHSHM
jgi:hypothetical protein